MRNFIKVAVFGVILIGAFTLFALKYAPVFGPGRPIEEKPVDISTMTKAEVEALGANLFHGKGTCTLCHDPLGARAPVLKDIMKTASERILEKGYRGGAIDASAYIYESLINPSAYVVKGYGVAGSEDTISPMPDVRTPAVGMNEAEITALIAYLESVHDPYAMTPTGQPLEVKGPFPPGR